MQTEVHVYAFSMAANVLLSFFPFLIVMVSLCRYVLQWNAAEQAIYLVLKEVFPDQIGGFIQRNLKFTVDVRGPFQVVSVLLLLFTANGIFEPLEVALNRAWGITKNRSYFRNQLVSFGLIQVCGALSLLSFSAAALHQEVWRAAGVTNSTVVMQASLTMFKIASVPISVITLIFIYWILPNGKIDWKRLVPVSVVVAILLELLKAVTLLIWPFLRSKLDREYGPFMYSATIVLWSFVASMIVLAGADWAARRPECADAAPVEVEEKILPPAPVVK
jgi:YihY family inner membrane protein